MTKRISCVFLSLLLVLALCSCASKKEDYISGTSFEMEEFDTGTYARYENRNFGIIVEYPEDFARVGNFELDGYVSFEGDGISVSVYVPDQENNDILTAEEYTQKVLRLSGNIASGNAKYGKSTGYRVVSQNGDLVRVDFTVKGVDAFYRFAYTAPAESFTEEDETFQTVMGSIRIDDGVYNKLTRMSSRYTTLLEYVSDMEYITDANYANHCLSSFEASGDMRRKQEAVDTVTNVRAEVAKVADYERDEGELYGDTWEEIVAEAKKIVAVCDEFLSCVENGDIAGAQNLVYTKFDYELADKSEEYLLAIQAEIEEY